MPASRGLMSRLGAGESSSSAPNVAESVAAHLRALLNTRQGDSAAVPELGLVDFTDLVHGFPHSIAVLQQSIRKTLLEFEPRLKNVTVKTLPSEDPLALNFEISAQLIGNQGRAESLRFKTQVTPGGHMEVW